MQNIIAYSTAVEPFITVETFNTDEETLNFLVNELSLYEPDYDYEPDNNFTQNLETVLSWIDENWEEVKESPGITALTVITETTTMEVG